MSDGINLEARIHNTVLSLNDTTSFSPMQLFNIFDIRNDTSFCWNVELRLVDANIITNVKSLITIRHHW